LGVKEVYYGICASRERGYGERKKRESEIKWRGKLCSFSFNTGKGNIINVLGPKVVDLSA